jgi:hypothetical protein
LQRFLLLLAHVAAASVVISVLPSLRSEPFFSPEVSMLTLELKDRIWGERPYTDIVRLVGYDGMYSDEFTEKVRPLVEEFTHEEFWAAADKIKQTDYSTKPYKYRLRPEVRSVAWVLLGPDPAHPQWWAKEIRQDPTLPLLADLPAETTKADTPSPKSMPASPGPTVPQPKTKEKTRKVKS